MNSKIVPAVALSAAAIYLAADVTRHYHGANVDQLPMLTVPSSANTDTGDTIAAHDTITGVRYAWEVRAERRQQIEQDS